MKEDHDFLIKTSSHHHYNVNGVPTKSYSAPSQSSSPASTGALLRLMIWLISFVSVTYLVYTLKLLSSPPCPSSFSFSSGDGGRGDDYFFSRLTTSQNLTFSQTHIPISLKKPTTVSTATSDHEDSTSLRHVVFGIAASARLWNKRKDYIKLWWRPNEMRGVVWLDKPVKTIPSERNLLPRIRISGNTTNFAYTHKKGHRSAIRISRIVSETVRLNLPEVRWFVMGDDDTVFFADNLVGVLQNFDHRQYHYIGSHSESHLQNIYFSYGMAFGGGGFAISYPLAAALSKMQDQCIQRYPGLYGSDDRMQACMSELGVPLTQHAGFHQYDVYGNLFGLLAAHPVTPLVSLHHLDVVEPVFPNETRVGALGRLFGGPAKLDSAGVMQQSTCYDADRKWTVSVSWGFAVQIIKGVLSPREMEMPMRTFLNWYKRADYTAYAFNTRPVARNPCERPFVYYLRSATIDRRRNLTITSHGPGQLLGGGASNLKCQQKMEDPIKAIDMVVVHKRPNPSLWKRSPRRNCCRVLKEEEGRKRTMTIDVGICEDDEISGI